MTSVVDHVIVCVPDLEESVRDFEDAHGVRSVPGGRHRGHGTANWLVPLGESYIELVAVVDADEAATSPFGRWVSTRSTETGADGLALRTTDLDGVCRRLGIGPLSMSRPTDAGVQLRWRVAGIEEMVVSGMPFFIEWDVEPDLHPGRIPVEYLVASPNLTEVVVSGDAARLREWVGDADGVRFSPGEPAVDFDLSYAA